MSTTVCEPAGRDPGSGSSSNSTLPTAAHPGVGRLGIPRLVLEPLQQQHHVGRSGPVGASAARALPADAPPRPSPSERFGHVLGGRYLRRLRPSGQSLSQAPSEGKHGTASSAEKGSGRYYSLNSSSCGFPTSRERRLHNCRMQTRGGSAPPPALGPVGEGGGRTAQSARRPPQPEPQTRLVLALTLPSPLVPSNVLTPSVRSDIRIS